MKKVPIKRGQSDACIDSAEREEARPKVKILFLHGFFASGQCQPALALREAFEGRAEVVSPDLPTHPKEALALIRDVIDRERPDVLVGNSCGSSSSTAATPIIKIRYGESSVNRTHWRGLSHCFWSTTTAHSISLVPIPLQQKR